MAAIDPSGIQISAVIRTTDGAQVDLWMANTSGGDGVGGVVGDTMSAVGSVGLGGAGSPDGSGSAELESMDLPYVESVDVEISMGLSMRITLVFACPFEIGLKLLETSLFQVGNTIEVQMGYPRSDRFTPWFSAMMSKPSIRINGDEGLTVTINGDGGSMGAVRGASGKVYEGATYKEIIKEIADTHGWATEFPGDTGFDIASSLSSVGGVTGDPLDETHDRVSQEQLPDWFFLQKLARTAGCDAFLGPNKDGKRTLYVKRRKDVLNGAPKYRLQMRGQVDYDVVFPILSFESEAEGVWLPGAAVEARTGDIDPDNGSVLDERASAETTQEAALGDAGVPTDGETKIEGEKQQLVAAGGGERTGEYVTSSKRDPRGQKQIIQAHRDESAIRGGVNAMVTIHAIPELLPSDIMEISGLGLFNSNYMVESMTFSANSAEFLAKLRLLNNASAAGLIDKVFLADAASSNTETAPESDEVGSGLGGGIVESVTGGL